MVLRAGLEATTQHFGPNSDSYRERWTSARYNSQLWIVLQERGHLPQRNEYVILMSTDTDPKRALTSRIAEALPERRLVDLKTNPVNLKGIMIYQLPSMQQNRC